MFLFDICETYPNKKYLEMEYENMYKYLIIDNCPPTGQCLSEITPHIIKYLHFIIAGKWWINVNNEEFIKLKNDYKKRGFYNSVSSYVCLNSRLPEPYYEYKQNHICKDLTEFTNFLIHS